MKVPKLNSNNIMMHWLLVMTMTFVQAAKGDEIFGNDHRHFLRQGQGSNNNISTRRDTTATRKMQDTQEQQITCVFIATGTNPTDSGYLDVLVDVGNGYTMVTTPEIVYKQGEVVLDECYANLIGVKVTNSRINAWAGRIETSVDNQGSYSVMRCVDCTGTVDTTEYIVVDGDNTGTGEAKCLDGITGNDCTLINLATLEPTPEPTPLPSLSPVTKKPTISPSSSPTYSPSTTNPTTSPSLNPSNTPTDSPSIGPTSSPSNKPTASPSYAVSNIYHNNICIHLICYETILISFAHTHDNNMTVLPIAAYYFKPHNFGELLLKRLLLIL